MDKREIVLETETIYEGRIVNLYLETVRLPNGRESVREVIRHGGAVAIVPLHEDGQVTLVRQFRLPAGTELLEIPAGTLEPGEDPLVCARRELQEEVGLYPGKLIPLGGIFLAPGYSSEHIHLYAARDLQPATLDGDEDEFLEVVTMPLDEVLAMIDRGEFADAKSMAALLRVARLVERGAL
ncbi:MAG: NUDIX hydrolase [Anaerolineae bacterium]